MRDENIIQTIFPYYTAELSRLDKENKKFAYYTDLLTTTSIIKNKTIWLRNVMCMNDYTEVRQGLNLLRGYLIKNDFYRNQLITVLSEIGKDQKYWENILNELLDKNESAYFFNTYIACFTEHENEDVNGNLNMFRTYGRNKGAAMIFSADTILDSQITISRVLYCDELDFEKYLKQFIDSLQDNINILHNMEFNNFENLLKQAILFAILSIKNPAFKEENEWRIIYCDKILNNPINKQLYELDVEVINGLPQKVYKLKLGKLNLKKCVEKIIIERIPDCSVAKMSLEYCLEKYGFKSGIVKISEIPIRSW